MNQITLKHLLKNDELYRKWFARTPRLPKVTTGDPWRLFIQKNENGAWSYRDYRDYANAYAALRTLLPKTHDAALNCKRVGYPPLKLKADGKVTWWPRPTYHEWCPYCRRPTIFRKMKQHPLHKQYKFFDPPQVMCSICSVRQEFVMETFHTEWPSMLAWPLD